MRNLSFIVMLGIGMVSCGEDKFYKAKFDETLNITNISPNTIHKIKVKGGSPTVTKIWVFENVQPNENRSITFNIKRDIKQAEGSIEIVAFISEKDSISTGLYFTNWQLASDFDKNIYIKDSAFVFKE